MMGLFSRDQRNLQITLLLISCFLFHIPETFAGGSRMLRTYDTPAPPVYTSPSTYNSPPYAYPSPPRMTETCSAAPKEFIDKLLHARRQDCESIAAECKKVAVSRGVSDTNCEDCKRKCLNIPHEITETCSAAPAEFINKLLYGKPDECESIAAECKKVAVYRGISDTNCEDCKRKCLNPPTYSYPSPPHY